MSAFLRTVLKITVIGFEDSRDGRYRFVVPHSLPGTNGSSPLVNALMDLSMIGQDGKQSQADLPLYLFKLKPYKNPAYQYLATILSKILKEAAPLDEEEEEDESDESDDEDDFDEEEPKAKKAKKEPFVYTIPTITAFSVQHFAPCMKRKSNDPSLRVNRVTDHYMSLDVEVEAEDLEDD